MKRDVPNLETLRTITDELVGTLTSDERATLITLSGELGSGKTTTSQMIGERLGVTDTMVSPTFVLEKVYELDGTHGFQRLIHIDAYRLKSGGELTALGFSEILLDSKNLILLEWPEMVMSALPKATIAITLTVEEDGTRTYNEEHGE